jgi:DNA-binding MarR family transcriptional regulator
VSSNQKEGGLSAEAAAAAAKVCACLNVRRAARAVTRLYDELLEPSGLRSTQFVVLVAVHAAGEPTLPSLAAELGLDRSALTRRLQPLERQDLLKVTPSQVGGASRVRLTAAGRRRLERTVPLWAQAQGRFVERLGAERWDALREALGDAERAAGRRDDG